MHELQPFVEKLEELGATKKCCEYAKQMSVESNMYKILKRN